MSVQISYKKQVLLGILLLIIIFSTIESFANIWWLDVRKCAFEENELFEDYDAETKRKLCEEHYEIRTTNTYLVPNQILETIHINSLGFRGSEFSIQKPENTYRIFIVGGSTIFGAAASSDKTTIAGYFQELVNHEPYNYTIEIINAGRAGANTNTELLLIKEKLVHFDPNLIIVYDGWNDLRADYSLELTKNNWQQICELGNQSGFDVIIALQPIAGFGKKILTKQEFSNSITALDHNGYQLIKKRSMYDSYANELTKLGNICTDVQDLRDLFDGTSRPIYYDEGHTANEGNLLIAKRLYEISKPIIDATTHSDLIVSMNKEISSNVESLKITPETFEKLQVDNREPWLIFDYDVRPVLRENFISVKNLISYYKTPVMLESFSEYFKNQYFLKNELPNNLDLIKKDFSGEDLSYRDFSGADMSYSNLSGANLSHAKLFGTNLSYSNLNNSILVGANLDGANLKGASLINSTLSEAILTHADLSTAILINANLSKTDLIRADLTNAQLTNATMDNAKIEKTLLNCLNHPICVEK